MQEQHVSDSSSLKVMRAAQATSFGNAADILTVIDGVASPPAPGKGEVQIKVYACSLSPGDYRMLSGAADYVKKPPSWPYIPGGDIAGTVVAVEPSCKGGYAIGDRVMGTWDVFGIGGLAEYTNVLETYVDKIPTLPSESGGRKKMSFIDAAAVVDSSVNALLALEDGCANASDRVLVLGGSGGVGTAVIQLLRRFIKNDNIIVATSTQGEILTGLGASHVIDHTKEKWHESAFVRDVAAPFDLVIDCAEGQRTWNTIVNKKGLVKPAGDGGRFVAVVVNEWHIDVHRAWDLVMFMWPMVKRTIASKIYTRDVPNYKMMFPAPRGDSLKRLLRIVEDGLLDVVIDKRGPHPFTTEGVREAFEIMVSRKGHGKVVVKIEDEVESGEEA